MTQRTITITMTDVDDGQFMLKVDWNGNATPDLTHPLDTYAAGILTMFLEHTEAENVVSQ